MTKRVSPVPEVDGVRLNTEQLDAVSGGDYHIYDAGDGKGVVFDQWGNSMYVGTLQECFDWIDLHTGKFG